MESVGTSDVHLQQQFQPGEVRQLLAATTAGLDKKLVQVGWWQEGVWGRGRQHGGPGEGRWKIPGKGSRHLAEPVPPGCHLHPRLLYS